MSGGVLGRRALNRATLERQLLLRRSALPVLEAIEWLVGLQAQTPHSWYVGLWTRLEGFDPQRVSDLLTERRVVRIALMRSTIHLVTARDCLALRPLLQPVLQRSMSGNFGRHLKGLDTEVLVAAGRALVEQQPRTPDTPAPPRFLYDYDNLLLSHADRTRVITDAYFTQGFTNDGPMPRIVLIDGFTNGTWTVTRHRGAATLVIQPFTRLSSDDADAVVAEGTRLLTMLEADAASHDVQLAPPK